MLSFNEIKEKVLSGQERDYTHLIIYLDTFDYTYSFRYVKCYEDVNTVIKEILNLGSPGMFKIKEVYNYSLDLESQLQEKRSYHTENNNYLESKALEIATKYHKGQTRFDGTPYIEHPKRVAEYIKKFKSKGKHLEILVSSALLHDTLEETSLSFYDIVDIFGIQIASLVSELTTTEDFKQEIGKTKYLEIKMKNMSKWALTIKLCDRLDNVSDLESCTVVFRNKYACETLEILDYLINNRIDALTQTQLQIIREIINKLKNIDYLLSPEMNESRERINSLIFTK